MKPEDIETCGRICYEAFKGIAEKHNFPPDFPVPEVAIELMRNFQASNGVFSVVAESDGRVIGRQTALFRWLLKNGMRVVKPVTLMSMGEYHEPRGCYLPSVGY